MAEIVNLDDLLDVDVPSPVDGDVVYWDEAAALWKARQPAINEAIVERLIRTINDDIDVRWNGTGWARYLTASYWTSGFYAVNNERKGGGGRFLNVYVPPGVTIEHAYFEPVASHYDDAVNVRTRLRGEGHVNPAIFSTIGDYLARDRTTAVVEWDNIPTWNSGTRYQSPDIKSVIQEIIDLDGWASGNPIVIFWDDHDDRSDHVNYTVRGARSWNHALRTPPQLRIEYRF